ncbi:hypothetical protein BGX38DRAFT_1098683 [Terfezia claveryi]|nr:hypothetical protein BGX38DRAFT_1098683 [Terfezia claveryi]
MSKSGFTYIYKMIKDNVIFYNNSQYLQAPIHKQVVVALRRFGVELSSKLAVTNIGQVFSIFEGSMVLYT